jgi:hypothetical protein
MIKDILTKAKSAISQPISQPAQVVAPEPAKTAPKAEIPSPAKAPQPEAALKATIGTARDMAVEAAKQAGLVAGDGYANIKLCRHQPFRHPNYLYAEGVPQAGWHDKIIVSVKDPESWKPVSDPKFATLGARWSGTANVDGVLLFESADICKANRLRRTPR